MSAATTLRALRTSPEHYLPPGPLKTAFGPDATRQGMLMVVFIRLVAAAALASLVGAPLPSSWAYPSSNNFRDLDICNHWNGRRHFLELGERGDLHARNVTASAFRSTLFSTSTGNERNRTSADIWYQCNLELVTCSECVIRITFTLVNFSRTCERVAIAAAGVGKPVSQCPCEHIQFSEPPYDTGISGQEYCGDGKVFRSQTRTLLLKFFYRATNSYVFSLQYFSERNVRIVSGSPRQSIIANYSKTAPPQVISTPYFPLPYPRDYGIEHILTCESDNCQVRLDFTDFQLGLTSTLEIFDSNGQMLDSYSGEHFRPPITISSGKSLLLQFRGNGVASVGFRAEVTFVSSKQLREERLIPYTDCGGMVSGPGGAITMMNMIENNTDVRLYDCIWLIKPGNNYMMMKTHISLHVAEFQGMASRSDLTIRQGTTSDAPKIENVSWPNNGMSKDNHIVPILTGYYIRLRGVFGMSSKLAIVYSVFNFLNCYIGSEFLCSNNHCISIRLHCDGFDHCGDGSDEPESCENDWAHLQNDRRWYSHKPNYYFPKIEQYPDLKTATGIFIISTLGIFAVFSAWMAILYRMGVRARHQRELQNHLQTISELLDRQEELTPDEPPSYEAPPDYEEVIKIGMEKEICEHRHRQRHNHRRHRDRSCSRASSNVTLQSMVPIHNGGGGGVCSSSGGDRPSTSAQAQLQQGADGCSDVAERVLRATVACDAATAFGAAERRMAAHTLGHYKSVGVSTSPPSLSAGCELSAAGAERSHISATASSCGSDNQLEERSDEFGENSLNISFTLTLPQSTPLTTSNEVVLSTTARPKSSFNCTEQTHLKRSWILVNNGTQNYKVQRLRHTYSSPESFPTGVAYIPEILGYGTNLPYDRSYFLSNATNFGSELSRDPSAHSIEPWLPPMYQMHRCAFSDSDRCEETHKQCALAFWRAEQSSLSGNDNVNCFEDVVSSETAPYQRNANDSLRQELICCDPDSDAGGNKQVSCFGAINRQFRVSNHIRGSNAPPPAVPRHHMRSKSFTSTNIRNHRTGRDIKRCSSADLLLCLTITTMTSPEPPDDDESGMYLI